MCLNDDSFISSTEVLASQLLAVGVVNALVLAKERLPLQPVHTADLRAMAAQLVETRHVTAASAARLQIIKDFTSEPPSKVAMALLHVATTGEPVEDKVLAAFERLSTL